MMESKVWYKSKTINFNALFLAIISALQAAGIVIPTEYVAVAQTILNLILRSVTSEAVTVKKPDPGQG